MSRLHFARVLFVLLLIVASTTMLQAQAGCNPKPWPTPCPNPCPTPATGGTHGAWEAYAFAGGTTHGNNIFNDTFVANGETFDTSARLPGTGTFGGKVGGF